MSIPKSILFLLFLCVFVGSSAVAQKDFTAEANNAFKGQSYYSAIDLYKKAYSKERKREVKTEIIFKIAECYRLVNNPKDAEAWYQKAIKADYPDPIVFFHLGEMYRLQGAFDEAIENYNKYLTKVPDSKQGKLAIKSCETAQTWKDNPDNYNIENVSTINSKFSDFSPIFSSKKMDELIFTSTRPSSFGNDIDSRTGQNFSDLYTTKIDRRGKWGNPEPLNEPVNSENNEGSAALDSKFKTLYFTRCDVLKNKVIGCRIYASSPQGRDWSEPDTLPITDIDSVNVGHPALSPDDAFMIFAADLPGGFGGKDLWLIEVPSKRDATWGEPVNLGSDINTAADEMFPFIRPNGELYFASNGHMGMGGLDIFKAQNAGNQKWNNVQNLKAPINSSAHDFGIMFIGTKDEGFFASDRPGGQGADDIYQFKRPPVIYALNGTVVDVDTEQPIPDATVKLIGTDGSSYETKTDQVGFYEFNEIDETDDRYIQSNTSYTILVSKQDYLNGKGQETTVGVERSTQFVHDFVLQSIKAEEITFPKVLYDLAQFTLRPESKDSLNFLYQTLVDNPNIVIELAAHTDSRGSDESNMVLSQKRAESCVNYLISKGIDPERLEPKGYGETKLLVSDEYIEGLQTNEEKEAAHQRNRRTVFSVLRADFVPKEEN